MRVSKALLPIPVIAAVLVAGGCASPSSSGSVYSSGEARREQVVRMGVVESVRTVTIEPARSGVGAATGGIVGGVAGSNVGGGRGSIVGSVLGAVVGGIAGDAAEGAIRRKAGLEITVKLDSGELRAITQESDEGFKPGDRVRLLSSGGTTRVTH